MREARTLVEANQIEAAREKLRSHSPERHADIAWALARTYGRENLHYSGPLYKSMTAEGNKIRLLFTHTADGLESVDGEPLNEFEIADKSGKFVKAKVEVDGHTLLVSAPDLEAPTQVRFAWHKVAKPNLVNSAGLPASPFRTEGWRGGTAAGK